jgi:hypothetical protein
MDRLSILFLKATASLLEYSVGCPLHHYAGNDAAAVEKPRSEDPVNKLKKGFWGPRGIYMTPSNLRK